jgi:hypothetical protein
MLSNCFLIWHQRVNDWISYECKQQYIVLVVISQSAEMKWFCLIGERSRIWADWKIPTRSSSLSYKETNFLKSEVDLAENVCHDGTSAGNERIKIIAHICQTIDSLWRKYWKQVVNSLVNFPLVVTNHKTLCKGI